MLQFEAEVQPRPVRAMPAFALDGIVIAISSGGNWGKRSFRTCRRMDGQTFLR
jgi:hypothetical protein